MLHLQQKVALRHARPAPVFSGVESRPAGQLPAGVAQHSHPPLPRHNAVGVVSYSELEPKVGVGTPTLG